MSTPPSCWLICARVSGSRTANVPTGSCSTKTCSCGGGNGCPVNGTPTCRLTPSASLRTRNWGGYATCSPPSVRVDQPLGTAARGVGEPAAELPAPDGRSVPLAAGALLPL